MPRVKVAYNDSGFEFLNRFIKRHGRLFYKNKLVLPNNSRLVFIGILLKMKKF